MTKIDPTVGRIVWYHPETPTPNGDPLAAKIAAVNTDGTINLAVVDQNGLPFGAQNVFLRQDGEANPYASTGNWAQWMPYQVGQAKKYDAPAASAEDAKAIPAPAPVSIDIDSITKGIDELANSLGKRVGEVEASTQSKFQGFGDWLQTHFGGLVSRVNVLEGKPPAAVLPPHPNGDNANSV